MKIDELSTKELLALCQRAEHQCAQSFRALYRRMNPGERDLRFFLLELAEEEEDHAAQLERMWHDAPYPREQKLDDAAGARLIAEHFPSFAQASGAGELDPEYVLRTVSSIEEQSTRWYRTLAEQAPAADLARFFAEVAAQEAGHLTSASQLRGRMFH